MEKLNNFEDNGEVFEPINFHFNPEGGVVELVTIM